MFQVGDLVIRKGSKVWEVASVTTVREYYAGDAMYDFHVKWFGGEDTRMYALKNPGKPTKAIRCWWKESELTKA